MITMCLPYEPLPVDVYTPEEGVGLIVNACKNSGLTAFGNKHKRYYYNTFITFDIETTKLQNELWKKGIPEKYRYFNVTNCWAVYGDDFFIFGRTIEDFFRMTDAVSQMLGGIYLICEVHNLAYEFNNNVDFFADPIRYEDSFFRNASTPLYVRLHSLEFRCTAQLTHKSLDQIGKDIGYAKLKEVYDYDRLISPYDELSLSDINYSYRDVKILFLKVKEEINAYAKQTHKKPNPNILPLTQTGYVRNDIKKNFSSTPEGRLLLKNTALSHELYKFIRPAFYGGNVHANFRIIGKELRRVDGKPLLHVDITSAYPWALCTKKFMLHLHHVDEQIDEFTLRSWLRRKDFGIIADVTLIGVTLKPRHIPYIPHDEFSVKSAVVGSTSENGKLVHADALRITLNDTDLKLVYDCYNIEEVIVNDCYIGTKKRLPYSIVKTVVDYFCGKTTLKDVSTGDPIEDAYLSYQYMLKKQMLNGIYGLFATALENFSYTIDPKTLEIKPSDDPEYKEASVLPYQIALQVTAYVREVTVSMCNYLCETKGCEFWYTDTDSIFCHDDEKARTYVENWNRDRKKELEELEKLYFDILPKNPKGITQYLGSLSIEEDCKEAVSFCTIGAKRYYIGYPDGTYEITFSGLRATKRQFDKTTGTWKNGRNTQRLIDMFGSMEKAFNTIKKGTVTLPYEEGTDKLGHYNVRAPFVSHELGFEVKRPCSYTLFPQGINLSLNASLKWFLESHDFEEVDNYD